MPAEMPKVVGLNEEAAKTPSWSTEIVLTDFNTSDVLVFSETKAKCILKSVGFCS